MPSNGYQAGGNVTPKSILVLATTAQANNLGNTPTNAGFQVILASGTGTPMCGISGQSTRWPQYQSPAPAPSIGNPNDTYHAVSGENCETFLEGEVGVVIAGAGGLTAGDLVTSDASGHGITATAGQETVGQALQTVLVNQECNVRVNPRKA